MRIGVTHAASRRSARRRPGRRSIGPPGLRRHGRHGGGRQAGQRGSARTFGPRQDIGSARRCGLHAGRPRARPRGTEQQACIGRCGRARSRPDHRFDEA
ncbi:hypothetical protein ISF6_0850 [Piscinibacter sakaiensis]|uniref:Uncharacterized protein n=1 Tax=Piscinibacter sakaiensis TaxID=1547922 RepID=A0A0K8NY95_PISS1|nr:hypothetical protein ISF6_0850 [Piscinibacter sakaiensis]